MKNSKYILTIILLCLGLKVYAYEYNQILTAYNGGVIGSLNNCGVNYSANPKYLRGAGSISLQAPGKKFHSISRIGESGIIAVSVEGDDGHIYYSPDGLNLSGGGNTTFLGKVPRFPIRQQGRIVFVIPVTGIISAEVEAENKVLLLSPQGKLMTVSSTSVEYFSFQSHVKFIGYANGKIYKQLLSGEIYTYGSISDLVGDNPLEYVETSSSTIRNIKSYGDGVLTLVDGSLYYSNSSDKLLTGPGVSNIYPDRNNTIANFEVISGEQLFIPIQSSNVSSSPQENGNIILAHEDGEISLNNETAIRPLNVQVLKSYLAESLGLSVDSKILKSTILNYGESESYGSGFFIGKGVDDVTMAIAVGLNGLPATVHILDRGWSNWEYRWRNKGERTGAFNHEYSGDIIGENNMKVIANHSCTAVVSVTDTNLSPFEYNTSLDASFFGKASGYNNNSVLPGVSLGIDTGWNVVDWYLTTCGWIDNGLGKLGVSVSSEDYGCTPNSEDWRPTPTFKLYGGTQFTIVNNELVWVR